MNTKTVGLIVLLVIVIGLIGWWFSMPKAVAPTVDTGTVPGQVQGASETNTYEDNSKDGAADSNASR